MAHREQPYLPLYIQDYLTDEKLNECSASTQGIYIKIMCLMHKSDEYGKILLGQKYKQNTSKSHILLGQKLSKHLTFACDLLEQAVLELVKEGVCFIDNDGNLCQKRMIKDGKISIKRAVSGKKGGESTKKKFARANSENENEYENDNEYKDYFEKEFWPNYPKRNGKKLGKAETFAALKRHVKQKEFVLVGIALANYLLSKEVETGFAKDPKRFFKNSDWSWRDWIEPPESQPESDPAWEAAEREIKATKKRLDERGY